MGQTFLLYQGVKREFILRHGVKKHFILRLAGWCKEMIFVFCFRINVFIKGSEYKNIFFFENVYTQSEFLIIKNIYAQAFLINVIQNQVKCHMILVKKIIYKT